MIYLGPLTMAVKPYGRSSELMLITLLPFTVAGRFIARCEANETWSSVAVSLELLSPDVCLFQSEKTMSKRRREFPPKRCTSSAHRMEQFRHCPSCTTLGEQSAKASLPSTAYGYSTGRSWCCTALNSPGLNNVARVNCG